MAKGFDTLNIKSAVKSRNKFDLSRTHLTTMNIGQIVPLFSEETVAGDDIKVNASIFSRMAPLVHPTYGKFSFKTMAGYVPYHQVAEDFEGWISGKNTIEGESTKFRHFTVYTLAYFVLNYCTQTANSADTQYTFVADDGTVTYRKWLNKGKYWVKIFNALGYALPQGVDFQTGSTWYKTEGQQKLSAYPLLAFFKLYNDYMSQSQRFNISALSSILRAIKQGKTASGYTPSTGQISAVGLKTMFDNLFLCYDNDYFTSAWREPNMALPSADNDSLGYSQVPASNTDDYIVRMAPDNFLQNSDSVFTQLGQRSLDWLKAFDNWVRRNNYSGSRAVQQIYSRFGIKTDDFRTHYAHILGTDAIPIQVGDITSTSDATGAQLGAYAGKGIANGGKAFECKADDYGLFLILGWISVTPMNAYGFDRKVLRNQPLDYYNPEFDGIGADAISAGEYFASPIVNPSGDTTSDLDIYGYTERYNSYRFGRDMITGDFRNFNESDTQDNSWHTGRLLTTVRQAGNLLAQSPSIINLAGFNSEYNRMFSITDGSVDLFYITANFGVSAVRPMLNHNQVPQLGEGNTVVPRNGNTVN